MHKRERLSVRIPWLLEAAAEGSDAIRALLALVVIIIATKGLGWW